MPKYYYIQLHERGPKAICGGICPDEQHETFYRPYFRDYGPNAAYPPVKLSAPREVVVVDGYRGHIIDLPADSHPGWDRLEAAIEAR